MKNHVPRSLTSPDENRSGRYALSLKLLRTLGSVGLLSFVILEIDTNRFGALTTHTDWGWWVLGLTLALISPTASAQRIRLLLRAMGHRASLKSIIAINLESIFFGLVTPGELMGGLVRWTRFSSHTKNWGTALTLVVAERLIDWQVLALLTAVGTPYLFAGPSAPTLRWYTLTATLTIATVGSLVAFASRRKSALRVLQLLPGHRRAWSRSWIKQLARQAESIQAVMDEPRRIVAVLLWTGAYWSIAFAGTTLMAKAVFPQMPVLPYVAATAALGLLTQIPLTVAGLGLRELSLPLFLGAYGVTSEVGLLIGLSAFVPHVLLGATGLIAHLIGRTQLGTEETALRDGQFPR